MSSTDIKIFTNAPLQMQGTIEYSGKTPQQVFEIMGDPDYIPDWYILAKEVRRHPPNENGEDSFNVVFTFFGDVYEEILHWNPPHQYIYLAKGEDFPIKDYIASIEVAKTGINKGVMTWKMYYSQIDGAHFQKILPIMLPPINRASLENLSKLIGGTKLTIDDFNDR